jgi:hypothetical protein
MDKPIKYRFKLEIPIFCRNKKKKFSKILIRKIYPLQHKYYKNICYEFYFRKNYLDSQPLNGETDCTTNLVVKIIIENNTNFIKDFRLIYMIDKTIRFKQFIDFQYLSNQKSLYFEENLLDYDNIYKIDFNLEIQKNYQVIPIDIIPTFFSRYLDKNHNKNKKINYGIFFNNSNEKLFIEKHSLPIVQLDGRSVINLKNQNYCLIDFLNDKIPKLPNEKIKNKLFGIPLFAIGYISLFLKKRPIWTKRIIEQYIPFSLKKYIKNLLPACCYRFKGNNPFKRTWVRYGYDPRQKKKTYIYQSLNIKKINNKYRIKKLSDKKKKSKSKNKYKRFYEQICDSDNESVKNFVVKKRNKNVLYIQSVSGWFDFSDFLKIKKKLKNQDKRELLKSV